MPYGFSQAMIVDALRIARGPNRASGTIGRRCIKRNTGNRHIDAIERGHILAAHKGRHTGIGRLRSCPVQALPVYCMIAFVLVHRYSLPTIF